MSLQQRLHRIRYEGSLAPTLANLRALQKSALLSLPFENLDIHAGRPIAFTREALDRKIVAEHRGGFCYELNSFFHDLLRDIGFRSRFAGARMFRDGQPGIPMGHMVLVVELDGSEWIVDVGNGKSCREPLDLAGSLESSAEGIRYRVGRIERGLAVLEAGPDGAWKPRFLIDPESRDRAEFIPASQWMQTAPESRFTQNRICTLALPEGRVTLMNDTLTVDRSGRVEERQVVGAEFEDVLSEHFRIRLDAEGLRRLTAAASATNA